MSNRKRVCELRTLVSIYSHSSFLIPHHCLLVDCSERWNWLPSIRRRIGLRPCLYLWLRQRGQATIPEAGEEEFNGCSPSRPAATRCWSRASTAS